MNAKHTRPRPEYIIYKGTERIGQAITWHHALNFLLCAESIAQYKAIHNGSHYITITDMAGNAYRIVKERG